MTALFPHPRHDVGTADPHDGTAQLPRRVPGQRLRDLTTESEVDWFGTGDPEWPTAGDLDEAEKARLQDAVNNVAVTPPDELAIGETFADRLLDLLHRL